MKQSTKTGLIVGVVGAAGLLTILALGGAGSGGSGPAQERHPTIDKLFRVLKKEGSEEGAEIIYEDSVTLIAIDKKNDVKMTFVAQERDGKLGITKKVEHLSSGEALGEAWETIESLEAMVESFGKVGGRSKSGRGTGSMRRGRNRSGL